MCGRFTLIRLSDFTDLFPWILPPPSPPPPRYNIAPAQPIAVVPNLDVPRIEFYHWGLVPSWAKDISVGNRMINARAETLAHKGAFKAALRRRRCLVPASGFYEWRKQGKQKTPMYIRSRSGHPLAFAGLWEVWHDPGGSQLHSCTIITTPPNTLMESIHDRMPAIVPEERYRDWLDPREQTPEQLQEILVAYPAEALEAFAVSPIVNSPKNESANCIEPMAQETPGSQELPGLFD